MASWILRGAIAAGVSTAIAAAAVACTGDDPNLTSGSGTDAAGDVAADDDGSSPVGDATDLADRGGDSALPTGTRRACEGTPRLAAAAGDRVLFEPYGILVDGTGILVGWEDSITKKVAVPVDPARRATVIGCCLAIGVGGGLAFAHGAELNVGTGDFSVFAQIKRLGSTLPSEATGGSAILKKPGAAFPFVGYALFLGHRDPSAGVLDSPSFQLQYDPQISVERSTAIPPGEFVVVAGRRQADEMRMRISNFQYPRARASGDEVSLDNPEQLFLGGGGDNHFSGQLCAVVLNVGDEATFEARASAINALDH